MEVAHGIRCDALARTAPLKRIKIIISRAASITNKRGRHTRVLALCDISAAFRHAQLPTTRQSRCTPPRGEASDVWDKTCIAPLP